MKKSLSQEKILFLNPRTLKTMFFRWRHKIKKLSEATGVDYKTLLNRRKELNKKR